MIVVRNEESFSFLPKHYPFQLHLWKEDQNFDFVDVLKWCVERFGEDGFTSLSGHEYVYFADRAWTYIGSTLYFKNPDHAFEFKMRWL